MTPRDLPDAGRWSPDDQLIPAILAGSCTATMAGLTPADKAWVVLNLTDDGYTAEFIAERMACSVRLVRTILSNDLGLVMRRYMETAEHFDREHRMASCEVARLARALAEAERDRDRYQGERNRLIDRLVSPVGPVFPCGCPRTKYNTYTAPKTGKQGCRHHRTLAQARYRERQRQRVA